MAEEQTRQRRPAPRPLLRPNKRVATPTRWCRNHKKRCIRVIAHRFTRQYRAGKTGRTHWSAKGKRAARRPYVREYHALCDDYSTTSATASEQRACPSVTVQENGETVIQTMTARQAWRRWKRDMDCAMVWDMYGPAGPPRFHLECYPVYQPVDYGSADEFLSCTADAFYFSLGAGTWAAKGGFGPAAGAFGSTMGATTIGCAIKFSVQNFVDW